MKKLFLKILILCVILTGSVFAIKTEAQEPKELLVTAQAEEKSVTITASNISQKVYVDFEIFKGNDKNSISSDRKKKTRLISSSTQTSTETFSSLDDANNWSILVTAYKDTDTEETKQKGAATFVIPGPAKPVDATMQNQQSTDNIDTDTTYRPLAEIKGLTDGCKNPDGTIIENCIDTAEQGAFAKYFNALITIFIGICAVLAMIMIVIGGMQYMTSELVSGKEEAKKRIWGAVGGLILALASYAILNTINPNLLDIGLGGLVKAEITISKEETSTGSSTSLCIGPNAPSPNSATGTSLTENDSVKNKYIPARNNIPLSKGAKLLITAQTIVEGFDERANGGQGTKSYRTNNPGNIGNTDDGSTKNFNSLKDGIQAQANIIKNIANNTAKSYKIGGTSKCALGTEKYEGYLYQYLRIYATAARGSNAYLNGIIGYFKQNGVTITPTTKIQEIYNMN